MIALIWFVLAILASPFKSKNRLEAENAVLRHIVVVFFCYIHSIVYIGLTMSVSLTPKSVGKADIAAFAFGSKAAIQGII